MSNEVAVRERNGSVPNKLYTQRQVAPPVDVYENADELLLVADVPGVASDGIDIQVENDTLKLEAKRHAEESSPALAREYEELSYARSFRIPAGIDASAITAEAKNGTLVVRMPKAAAAKPRKIVVR